MSDNQSLRAALIELAAAVRAGEPMDGPLGAALDFADRVAARTGFAAPALPAVVADGNGTRITLIGVVDDQLIGVRHGSDGPEPLGWNLDGSFFNAADPDENDLVLLGRPRGGLIISSGLNELVYVAV